MFIKFVCESKIFEGIILLAILVNCIIMAMTNPVPQTDVNSLNAKLEQSELFFVVIFLVECIIKVISYGFVLHKGSYIRNPWNFLDFCIVVVGLITLIIGKVSNGGSIDVKALRAFRVLRPLRLISNIPSLQVVLVSIIRAMKPLANIAILILFLMVVYSIVGMDLFMGKMHATCYNNVTLKMMDNPSTCSSNKASNGFKCTNLSTLPRGQQWICKDYSTNVSSRLYWPGPNDGINNFDNIWLAMLTVFQVITKKGWTKNLYWANDAVGNEYPWIYFVSLIFIITFFVMNLILGVLSGEFSKQSSKSNDQKVFLKEKRKKKENEDYLGYKNWIEYVDKLDEFRNQYRMTTTDTKIDEESLQDSDQIMTSTKHENQNKSQWSKLAKSFTGFRIRLQKSLRAMIKSRICFIVILVIVFLNTVTMATEYTNQPIWLSDFQDKANLVFVIFFTLELIVKLFALGFRDYFAKPLNVFDFIVVISSIVEICLMRTKVINQVGLSVLRCARLLRGFKLTQYWDTLRTLVYKMLSSIKSIISLLLLLGLLTVIFSLLGMQIFGGKFPSQARSNFDSFAQAFFTVFQILTGDDWSSVMYNGINANGGIQSIGALCSLYFVVLFILGNYIFLNVFLAIAVENLSKGVNDDNDDIESTTNETDDEINESNLDMEAKQPETTDHLVVLNGYTVLPPVVKSNIVSINKIKKKSRKRASHEQRVQINFAKEEIIEIEDYEDTAEINRFGYMTYNDLYAEEEADNESIDINPVPTMIPRSGDFKRLKEVTVSIPPAISCFIFRETNIFRVFCFKFVNHSLCKNIILVSILISSVTLACEDPVNENSGRNLALRNFDYFFTAIFSVEIIIKLIAYGIILHKNSFLRNPFNWVDLVVVVLGIIDIILEAINLKVGLSALKTLRVLRVLRPLRAINRAKGLKHVLSCFFVALKTIAKIMIIACLLVFMFSVIGVIVMKGTFSYCNDPTMLTRNNCIGNFNTTGNVTQSRIWVNSGLNYDNVGNGMLTLLVVATFSGWTTILYKSIDANIENLAPIINRNPAIFIYYLIYIILLAFFMINIFVGMVIVTFQKEGDAQFSRFKLDKNRRTCINFALKARPIVRYIPDDHKRYKMWRFVDSKKFEYLIIIIIILNTIVLAANYMNQPTEFNDILDYFNTFFTVVFTLECVLKIYAYNFRNYFNDKMNVFDIIVLTGSYVDLVFSVIYTKSGTSHVSLFRLFRVFRLIRLLTKVQAIRRIIWTFLNSFRSLPYVFMLLLLAFFIYAIMGMQFFGKIGLNNPGSVINRNNNFQTFLNSLLVLFRCITGGDWESIMLSCIYDPIATCVSSSDICGTAISYVYFVTFVMMCTLLIMNLFVAVIIENFDYLTRDDSILGAHHLEKFIDKWSQYDCEGQGRINHLDIGNMLASLNPPLGFGKMCPQIACFRNLARLNLPLQTDGTVLFNATLFALVRKSLRIKHSESFSDKPHLKGYNDELRTIIRTYWKKTSPLLLDQIIPPNINDVVTIGKFNAIILIKNWYKKCMINKRENKNEEMSSVEFEINSVPRRRPKRETESSVTTIPESVLDNTVAAMRDTYEKFSERVWSALEDVFTIKNENATSN